MTDYFVRRILTSVFVVFGLSIVAFSMIHFVPGDPVELMYSRHFVAPVVLANVRHEFGLDLPLPVQYVRYISHALVGDLGRSIRSDRPVFQEIMLNAPSTLELAMGAMIASVLIGTAVGILSAVKRGSALDKSSMVLALAGVSIPTFWMGLVLMYAFSIQLHLFPVVGQGPGRGLVLPALTLAIGEVGVIARLVRSSMLEVLGMDYLTTARGKGLPERYVILRHALRNALIPVITVFGMEAGYLLTGSMIVEVVFARPGIGTLAVQAILDRDFPVVQGTVLFTSIVFVSINTLVDLLYGVVDPRIRHE